MAMPGRTFSTGKYRFGFNGKEKDDEIKGDGNSYNLGIRMYDVRIIRMFSLDPRFDEYPWQSAYAYHRNNAVNYIDFLGGGDPPTVIKGVYFVKIQNPSAKLIYNSNLSTFTNRVKGSYDNYQTDDYTINLQQYESRDLTSYFRALSSNTGGSTWVTLGQNVQDGKITGQETDNKRAFMAQCKDGTWQVGLGNPPEDAKVGFGGGIPIIVGGQLYGEENTETTKSAKGYANQNKNTVGKVIIGYNSSDDTMILVVSPDELETGGMTLDEIRDKLADEGYDYVLGFDGGSSSTLIQDGKTELVSPKWYKDNSIPVGLQISGD